MKVWQVFESVAARCAERVAVEVQRQTVLETWTYRQLHAAAGGYAGWLAAAGVAVGDRCMILADNDARWCAAYLGTLCLGAVVVPVDTNVNATQLATIIRSVRPRVLFVNERLAPIADEAVAGHHVIVALLHDVGSVPLTRPRHDIADAATAVIVHTSGTTADPKGVVLSHANLLAARDALSTVVRVSEDDAVLGVLPLFDAFAHLANLLLPLLVGARVVFLETAASTELVRALGQRRITIFAGTPSLLYLIHERILGEVARSGRARRATFRALVMLSARMPRVGLTIGPVLFRRVHKLMGGQIRLLITGGSTFDPSIARDFAALGFIVLQAYSLTETSGVATLTTPAEAGVDTVGRAFPGHELRILPSDEPDLDGEVAIRGPSVMQGYYDRCDATDAVTRDGWLLTGDLGRIDAGGRLTLTARRKDAIVLASGQHVYPEEIEAQYRHSQFIEEACVMMLKRGDEPAAGQLHAIVVPALDILRQRRIANAGDLIRFEIEGQSVHLPPHKRVLGYDVWFEPLPRTTTGKLKRHEIASRVQQKHLAAAGCRDDDTQATHWKSDPHAAETAAIIARCARGAPVAPDSNLEIDLSLDSMARVELIADLEQRFGVSLSSDQAAGIMTVAQLIEAVRPRTPRERDTVTATSWSVLLRDLPPATDSVVAPLVRNRLVVPLVFFVVLRALRPILPRLEPSGVEHLPPQGPYIIAPNHQSYLDPLFVCSVLPLSVLRRLFFVGATEYFETPLTAWVARQLNLVPVDPDANLVPAMKAGAFGLAHGRVLVVFPEGERSIDGTVKHFKKGATILSRHLDVLIVPVAIHGVFELWPRNRPFNWRLLRPWSRHVIHVAFGRPLRGATDAGDADRAAALRDVVKTTWEAIDRSRHNRTDREPSGRSLTP